jgi:hypothetical protein
MVNFDSTGLDVNDLEPWRLAIFYEHDFIEPIEFSHLILNLTFALSNRLRGEFSSPLLKK